MRWERLRLILQLLLKLEHLGYNNNNGDFVIQHYLREQLVKVTFGKGK